MTTLAQYSNSVSRHRCHFEQLESRALLSGPSGLEQQLLYDINRMRVNPHGELSYLFTTTNPLLSPDPGVNNALQYLGITSANFLPAWQTLTSTSPLAWNASLYSAATSHNQQMIDYDLQWHQLPGEPGLAERFALAGYSNVTTGSENIFIHAESVFHGHSSFAIDWGVPSLGHRLAMMDARYQEAGVAVATVGVNPGQQAGPLVITEDFAARLDYGNPAITGVVFNDTTGDSRYDAGEGLGGITITVTSVTGTFVTTTNASGGYQVKVPSGAYTITANGAGFLGTSRLQANVVTKNIAIDFVSGVSTGYVIFVRVTAVAPYQNPLDRLDVNNDGRISPSDALVIINRILVNGTHQLSAPTGEPLFYVDVNGDNTVSPTDLLIIVNDLLLNGTHPTSLNAPTHPGLVSPLMASESIGQAPFVKAVSLVATQPRTSAMCISDQLTSKQCSARQAAEDHHRADDGTLQNEIAGSGSRLEKRAPVWIGLIQEIRKRARQILG